MTPMTTTIFPVAEGTRLLGEVISWTCNGVTVPHTTLVEALTDAVPVNLHMDTAPRTQCRACTAMAHSTGSMWTRRFMLRFELGEWIAVPWSRIPQVSLTSPWIQSSIQFPIFDGARR